MALPQDISPVNSELMDSLCKTDDMDWIPMEADPERGFMKVLFFDENNFTSYLGWEELQSIQQEYENNRESAAS